MAKAENVIGEALESTVFSLYSNYKYLRNSISYLSDI